MEKNEQQQNKNCQLVAKSAGYCPFENKTKNDIEEWIKIKIEDCIKNRSMTYDEIETLSEVFKSIINVAMSNHDANCLNLETIKRIDKELENFKIEKKIQDKDKNFSIKLKENKINIAIMTILFLTLMASLFSIIFK